MIPLRRRRGRPHRRALAALVAVVLVGGACSGDDGRTTPTTEGPTSTVEVTTTAFGEAVPAVPSSGPAAWRLNRRVEVVLERYLVTLPACPDWSRESGTDFDNLPLSNFGCATQANLGLMVAEPKDLVRGRPLGPADGVQQAEGIVRYRTGKVVELEETEVQN